MSVDFQMLAWVTFFTAAMWLPYILAHIVNVGLVPALTYRADDTPLPAWAQRAKQAHYNAIENLVPFAILVVVAHILGAANAATASAATVYLFARLAHYPLYILNVPLGRTLTFAVGWFAMACIFYQIITAGGSA